MKICFVTESFYPEINGCAVHSRLLAEKINESGHDVLIVTRRPNKMLSREEIFSGVKVIRSGLDSRFAMIGRYIDMLTILLPLIKYRQSYDIVMIAAPRILGAPIVLLMKVLGKKCVIKPDSCGEMDGSYALNQLSKKTLLFVIARIYFMARNIILKKADAYVSISGSVFNEIYAMGIKRKRIEIIPNGVDDKRFKPINLKQKKFLRNEIGLHEESIIFAYSGRLTYEKGLVSLLRVWKRLTEKYDNVHLLLIGTGKGLKLNCEDELKFYIEHNHLEKSVTFTGPVEDVYKYLICADIFVLPSLTEALGVALIEAQLCGIPAIASDVGGIPDVIIHGENGFLVEADKDEVLFEASVQLINDSGLRKSFGKAARIRAMEKFSITKIRDSYLSLFDSVLTA